MATAADCFTENIALIGGPLGLSTEQSIQWNLNNGLRMLADQVTQMERQQHHMEMQLQAIHALLRQLR